jgi:hypothetical protein
MIVICRQTVSVSFPQSIKHRHYVEKVGVTRESYRYNALSSRVTCHMPAATFLAAVIMHEHKNQNSTLFCTALASFTLKNVVVQYKYDKGPER